MFKRAAAAADMSVVTEPPNNNWVKFGDLLMEKRELSLEKCISVAFFTIY
jgi:hypothetical protein